MCIYLSQYLVNALLRKEALNSIVTFCVSVGFSAAAFLSGAHFSVSRAFCKESL